MEQTILYHGSSQIVREPEIRIARFNKDFYFGFYCTLFKEQAKRWATRQISFHTARALTTLTYLKGYEVNDHE